MRDVRERERDESKMREKEQTYGQREALEKLSFRHTSGVWPVLHEVH